ncbi:alternative oxidase [Methylophaga nitratireducenticrescens]
MWCATLHTETYFRNAVLVVRDDEAKHRVVSHDFANQLQNA